MSNDPKPRTGILRVLELMGFETTNENGHDLGCPCAECRAASERAIEAIRERRARGESGHTLLDVLADAKYGKPKPPAPPAPEDIPRPAGDPPGCQTQIGAANAVWCDQPVTSRFVRRVHNDHEPDELIVWRFCEKHADGMEEVYGWTGRERLVLIDGKPKPADGAGKPTVPHGPECRCESCARADERSKAIHDGFVRPWRPDPKDAEALGEKPAYFAGGDCTEPPPARVGSHVVVMGELEHVFTPQAPIDADVYQRALEAALAEGPLPFAPLGGSGTFEHRDGKIRIGVTRMGFDLPLCGTCGDAKIEGAPCPACGDTMPPPPDTTKDDDEPKGDR